VFLSPKLAGITDNEHQPIVTEGWVFMRVAQLEMPVAIFFISL
jgi:hypothetical protein